MTIRKGLTRIQLAEVRASREHLDDASAAPRCGHIKANGVPCGSPALNGSAFCYYHDRHYNQPFDDSFPPLEDAHAIQVALNQVLDRLRGQVFRLLDGNNRLDRDGLRGVNALLYGLQTASANSKRIRFDSLSSRHEMVTTLSSPPTDPATAKPPQSVKDGNESL